MVIGYFSYGFWLNLTLKEAYEVPNKTFGINIFRTDDSYKSGICKQILKIYPWEDPSHQLVTPNEYGHVKVDCSVRQQDGIPFGFEYVRAFNNKRELSSFSISQHSFWTVKKIFFNKPLSICLEGIDTLLPLKETVYSPRWFSIRGLKYTIALNDDLKSKWKTHIDRFFENSNFPTTANLIEGTSCENYSDRDTIKKYPIVSKNGWW